jgi:dihydrofolate reductase
MRKVIVSTFVTLDGVQDDPHEWSLPYFDDEYGQLAREQLFAADAVLMGRVTYEGFAASWPEISDAGTPQEGFADRLNSLPKYVVSGTLAGLAWNNSRLVAGDVVAAVRELKHRPGQDILMYGCGAVARTLWTHGLLDEIRLWVHPLVLGSGGRVFDGWAAATSPEPPSTSLRLVGSRQLPTGVVVLTYAPGSEAPTPAGHP